MQLSYSFDTILGLDNMALDYLRIFQDKIAAYAYWPISQTRRLELGASLARYNYRWDRYNNYYYNTLYK